MTVSSYIELIAGFSIPLSLLAIVGERIWSQKGLGVRTIQLLGVATFAPLVLILALERIIDGTVVAALVGAFVGYLFSNISDFDRRRTGD